MGLTEWKYEVFIAHYRVYVEFLQKLLYPETRYRTSGAGDPSCGMSWYVTVFCVAS